MGNASPLVLQVPIKSLSERTYKNSRMVLTHAGITEYPNIRLGHCLFYHYDVFWFKER